MQVTKRDGSREPRDVSKVHKVVQWACKGLDASPDELVAEANLLFHDGMKTSDIHRSLIAAAAGLNSVQKQDYTFVAARLLLQQIYKESWGGIHYPHLADYLAKANDESMIDARLVTLFDVTQLQDALEPTRDMQFTYIGLQTLADRYLLRDAAGKKVIELPQHFFMRVAMGLALNEDDPTARAIEFYNVLSTFEFMSSTPTLFNAGTRHPQLASCFLNTVADSITNDPDTHRFASIYGTIEECAILSKYAGGVGTDWHRVRSIGDHIKGTNGKSSGVVPYLKVYNDTAVAVNQGGKRQGSFAPYLEPHHPDFYPFTMLKKESGDERQRAHDIYPAVWLNDLLMERKEEKGVWSFFSPKDYPELHELHGEAFRKRYLELEAAGAYVEQKPAMDVWKQILGMLFETGHPWITFKDECNRRNPQQHVGVIHNSNLCTEITLNTSDEETAVCNIGSVNMAVVENVNQLRHVVRTAMRMLDNVIDINFYGSDRARAANMRHRPVGLGMMGYAEWLVKNGIAFESQEHLEAADALLEQVSYFAIEASSDLAAERGSYSTFEGSLWSKGILPIDTAKPAAIALTQREYVMNWSALRTKVQKQGMRNSNTMAIAPTATISNIVGTTPTIEPPYELENVKKNTGGNFIVVDPSLRYGRPDLCKAAHDVDQEYVIKGAAVRQKWIDQAQSTTIFVKANVKGKDLNHLYTLAWTLGLKTTYYLRGQSAKVEKAPVVKVETPADEPVNNLCSLDNPDCEACQ
ncbi:ribonucleoside-diphosphate reductase subunit alpha [Herbaspirillum huttiense]|uniref:Ribonucleoside-diphosphate reductase n=1 Tax=Herbaspirillum huttiense subsp. lycopersici TaxID=3074428 RepID=A0ABU2EGV4_9BURK|nr:ribonucleoside-diphosphate reductase subunit alpha [Herbaspirillum huttiense]MDR9847107.1 ribonucleoside-diphosphate reductase subunit alpha [Herbaspirillum huttiense SE1]